MEAILKVDEVSEGRLTPRDYAEERRLEAYKAFLRETGELRDILLKIDNLAFSTSSRWGRFEDMDFEESQRKLDRLKVLAERIKADTSLISIIKAQDDKR